MRDRTSLGYAQEMRGTASLKACRGLTLRQKLQCFT
jgi:hypothetical protein